MLPQTRRRLAFLLLLALPLAASPTQASPRWRKTSRKKSKRSKKTKKKGPVWPVPNPTFQQRGFTPSSRLRQISGVFGPRLKWGSARYDHHEGLDFYAHFDTSTYPGGAHPVFSVLPGVVSDVISPANAERTETGRKVVITHDLPWTKFGGKPQWGRVQTAYLHLRSIKVRRGQRVAAGETIGVAGESGHTTTVHLHFNAYRAGGRQVHVNPARLFSPRRFAGHVAPLNKRTVEVDWLELDRGAGTALVRVLLPYNAYTLDGFQLVIGKDGSRRVSFEQVSAEQRSKRDTGDRDLFPKLKLFPLRYNGGGTIDRVNARSVPGAWPMARYPVKSGKGVRLGFDLLATGVPKKAKKFRLIVRGVLREKVSFKAPGFRHKK